MRKIIHIDMDCFYAAVEMRDQPHLASLPLAVGGSEDHRGVLCTSNYMARQFGVRSAMATAYAKRLCPDLVIVSPNMAKYRDVSKRIQAIFHDYTDLVEPLSLDEAYLDVSACEKHQGSATLIAEEIRQRIFDQEKLTASAGVASNKLLAKIASDMNKPNGCCVITPESVDAFMENLPVKKLYGVGKVTAKKLADINIHTCADLQQVSIFDLEKKFNRFGERLYFMCRGQDDRSVEPIRERKSLSVEHTFDQDIRGAEVCIDKLKIIFAELTQRLARHSEVAVAKQFVKIKFSDFQQTTVESIALHPRLDVFNELLLKGLLRHNQSIRLLGLGVGFRSCRMLQQQLEFPVFDG